MLDEMKNEINSQTQEIMNNDNVVNELSEQIQVIIDDFKMSAIWLPEPKS